MSNLPKLGVGRYGENLRRLLTITGVENEPADLSPELQASFVLENDRPEWAHLRGERLASIFGAVAGAALNRSVVSISNPTASGILVVIEQIHIIVLAVDVLPTVRSDVVETGATLISGRSRDRRYDGIAAARVRTNNTLTNAGVAGQDLGFPRIDAVSAARTYASWDKPVILPPRATIGVVSGGDNESLDVTFLWRERELRRFEL